MRKDPWNYRPINPVSVPEKIMEIILGTAERHLKTNAVIRHCQRGFTKGRSCLINLTSFQEKVTCLVGEGNVVDVVFLVFSEGFDAVLHSVVLDKLWDDEVQGVLCVQLAEGQSSKGCGEWGCIWLLKDH